MTILPIPSPGIMPIRSDLAAAERSFCIDMVGEDGKSRIAEMDLTLAASIELPSRADSSVPPP